MRKHLAHALICRLLRFNERIRMRSLDLCHCADEKIRIDVQLRNAVAYGAAQILISSAGAAVQNERHGHGSGKFTQALEVQFRCLVALVDTVRCTD